uniref:Uncharacterized protein n=1 Tax=Cacopsylla melanoneura TaxID=428564 RepID=A0A8D9E9V7_9HEMI
MRERRETFRPSLSSMTSISSNPRVVFLIIIVLNRFHLLFILFISTRPDLHNSSLESHGNLLDILFLLHFHFLIKNHFFYDVAISTKFILLFHFLYFHMS